MRWYSPILCHCPRAIDLRTNLVVEIEDRIILAMVGCVTDFFDEGKGGSRCKGCCGGDIVETDDENVVGDSIAGP